MEDIDKLNSEFKGQQQRFAYYIVAVNVACIAYCVDKSIDVKIEAINTPLALSIILFGVSAFKGLRFIQIIISTYYTELNVKAIQKNISYKFDKIVAESNLNESHEEAKNIALRMLGEITERTSNKATDNFNWAMRMLSLGITSFIVWRVLIASQNTFGVF